MYEEEKFNVSGAFGAYVTFARTSGRVERGRGTEGRDRMKKEAKRERPGHVFTRE